MYRKVIISGILSESRAKLQSRAIWLFLLPSIFACSLGHPPAEPLQSQADQWGCLMPPAVISLNRQGLILEGPSVKELAVGKADYRSSPELKVLVEQDALNSAVSEYLVCGAVARGEVDKNDPDQIDYLRRFLHFMSSGPTPEQITVWQRENRVPTLPVKRKEQFSKAYAACTQQQEQGYALQQRIEREYRWHRHEKTWHAHSKELISKWYAEVKEWLILTEGFVKSASGPLALGRFRNARIPTAVRAGENYKWSGLMNFIRGKLEALDGFCQQLKM